MSVDVRIDCAVRAPRRRSAGPKGSSGNRWASPKLAVLVAVALALLGAQAAPALAVPVTAKPPSASEGAPFSTAVATFTDAVSLFGCPSAGQYTATINWGDGATATGTISVAPGILLEPCQYTVSGAHTYAEEGRLTYSISLAGPMGTSDTGSAVIVVGDAALSARGIDFSTVQNTAGAAAVANFTDADPAPAATDFSATISWGDGTTAPGTVTAGPAGMFTVTGSHSYARSASFAVSVVITDAGGSQATAGATAKVLAVPATGTVPPSVTPPSGAPKPAPLRLGLSAPVLARGGTVIVGVRCPVAAKLCRGQLKVATVPSTGSRLPALRAAQTLGTALFIIPGGRRAELTVRPKRAVLGLLRRAGLITVAAYASFFDTATGQNQVASLTAKLKLAPRGG